MTKGTRSFYIIIAVDVSLCIRQEIIKLTRIANVSTGYKLFDQRGSSLGCGNNCITDCCGSFIAGIVDSCDRICKHSQANAVSSREFTTGRRHARTCIGCQITRCWYESESMCRIILNTGDDNVWNRCILDSNIYVITIDSAIIVINSEGNYMRTKRKGYICVWTVCSYCNERALPDIAK